MTPLAPGEEKRDYTHYGFLTYAESYGRSAFILAGAIQSGVRMTWPVPVVTLALHCVELSLKSVLVKEGMTPYELHARYRHDLEKLFEATPLDWSDFHLEEIQFYNDALLSQALRYRYTKNNEYYDMDLSKLLPFMEKVFHRCLEHISPGAKRTLRPAHPGPTRSHESP